ncbi:DM13 domain-containing protein [Planomonospora sp. ID91781]|uniref:DM13 domain-containing protein n=1 Tax=Planomonospora sp. ID91781 TaxID=2738135 RepID=UPI0018C44AC8|nr:DM13 domain-containing protein [Planomonospora sp. ID91781]MBG0820020.1 DM13 domain-containing protein [Planomonospora sp. ID91781]
MRTKRPLRHPAVRVVLALGAAGLAVALYLFQPWRLFTTVEVNEAPPSAAASSVPASSAPGAEAEGAPDAPAEPVSGPRTVATGVFVSHEHDTTGTAKVLELADGRRVLRIEDLDTSDGPDLRVWLSDQPVKEGRAGWFNLDDGEHLELGGLKGNKGDANYAIPAGADLEDLRTVTIWCRRFSVSFGAAALA